MTERFSENGGMTSVHNLCTGCVRILCTLRNQFVRYTRKSTRLVAIAIWLVIQIPVTAVAETADQDFQEAVLSRCLPAALTNSKVQTKGLKKLSQKQKNVVLGGAKAPAYLVGDRVILAVAGRGNCQVGVFGAEQTSLAKFPDEWLVGNGAPFQETKKPRPDTRFFVEPGGASVSYTQRPGLTLFSAVAAKK